VFSQHRLHPLPHSTAREFTKVFTYSISHFPPGFFFMAGDSDGQYVAHKLFVIQPGPSIKRQTQQWAVRVMFNLLKKIQRAKPGAGGRLAYGNS
jgi:hypothetical protein